jgi:hypothetical protein
MYRQNSCFATSTPVSYDIRRGIKKFPELFDIDCSVHCECVPPGQSVTGHFYVHVLQRLRDAVRREGCDKWQAETVVSASR